MQLHVSEGECSSITIVIMFLQPVVDNIREKQRFN